MKLFKSIQQWFAIRSEINRLKKQAELYTGFLSEYPASPDIRKMAYEELLAVNERLAALYNKR